MKESCQRKLAAGTERQTQLAFEADTLRKGGRVSRVSGFFGICILIWLATGTFVLFSSPLMHSNLRSMQNGALFHRRPPDIADMPRIFNDTMDPNDAVREKAAFLLRYAVGTDAVHVLIYMLADSSQSVRQDAAASLIALAENLDGAKEIIIKTARNESADRRMALIELLPRIGVVAIPGAEELLRSALYDNDSGVRLATVKTLADIGTMAAVPDLFALAAVPDTSLLRDEMLKALTDIAWRDCRVATLIKSYLYDQDPLIVATAADAVMAFGCGDARDLQAAMRNPDRRTQKRAFGKIKKIPDYQAVPLLCDALCVSCHEQITRMTLDELHKRAGSADVPYIYATLLKVNPHTKADIVALLATVGGRDAVNILSRLMFCEEDEALRRESALALGKINHPAVITMLTTELQRGNLLAATALSVSTSKQAEDLLLAYFDAGNHTVMAAACLFFIPRAEAEPAVVAALYSCGDKAMAEAMHSSGRPNLRNAAATWAENNGYVIVDQSFHRLY